MRAETAHALAEHYRAIADLLEAEYGEASVPVATTVLLVTADQLREIFSRPGADDLDDIADHLQDAMMAYGITTTRRVAAFLAQIGHESAGLRRTVENLNYTTAARIRVVWPARFPSIASAEPFVRNPSGLANHVYADRMGNSAPETGDGWKYRGRGYIQLTGRDNYRQASQALGVDFEAKPDLVAMPKYAAATSAWFWGSRDLNDLADAGDMRTITRRINGGLNGLDDRLALYHRAIGVLS